jgi:hypothetical protein
MESSVPPKQPKKHAFREHLSEFRKNNAFPGKSSAYVVKLAAEDYRQKRNQQSDKNFEQ